MTNTTLDIAKIHEMKRLVDGTDEAARKTAGEAGAYGNRQERRRAMKLLKKRRNAA